MPQRILIWSPYAMWHYHSAIEATVAHALRLRGHEVLHLLCDGLFRQCDVYRISLGVRPTTACLYCQAHSANALMEASSFYRWGSRYLALGVERRVKAWAAALPAEDLMEAVWEGRPVGRWAQSSAFYQFRMSRFDLGSPVVVDSLRAHVEGAALSFELLSAAFDDFKPDSLLLLNGRFFSHWAAVEIARERGIRYATHERGLRRNSLRFVEDGRIHDFWPFHREWERWSEVPLSRAEAERVEELLMDRRLGRNLSWKAFSPPPQDEARLRERLRLDHRPVIAVYTSSDDEVAAFPEWREGAFPDSFDFLPGIIAQARRRPEHIYVIRLHPNLVGYGVNQQSMRQAEEIAADLPENVRMVFPADDISSYTLGDLSSAVLVYMSTIGLELACQGKPVLMAASGWYKQGDFAEHVDQPEALDGAILRALERGTTFRGAQRARRFAHRVLAALCVDFPLVSEERAHMGTLTYKSVTDLAPGKVPVLDQICEMVVAGVPMARRPQAHELARSSADEEDFLVERGFWLSGAPDLPLSAWAERRTAQGEARFMAGDLEGAQADFAAVLKRCPQHEAAWVNLGVAMHASGDNARAIGHLQAGLSHFPHSADLRANLSLLLLQRGDGAAAAALLAPLVHLRGEHELVGQAFAAMEGAHA